MHRKVYICIPVFNRIHYTLKCLESIFNQSYENFHVVISDAGSSDRSKEIIEKHYPEKVIVISIDSSNFWTGGINACIKHVLSVASSNDLVYTLNNDTELAPDCISTAVDFVRQHPDHIVGSLNLFFFDKNRIEPSAFLNKGTIIKTQTRLFKFGQLIPSEMAEFYNVDALSGKGVLFQINVFTNVGLYNAKLLPHYHADTEYTQRCARSGYKISLLTKSRIYSHVYETGEGTMDLNTAKFIKSFTNLKSANHIKSIKNYSKLVYKSEWLLYFLPKLLFIILGFLKRIIK